MFVALDKTKPCKSHREISNVTSNPQQTNHLSHAYPILKYAHRHTHTPTLIIFLMCISSVYTFIIKT